MNNIPRRWLLMFWLGAGLIAALLLFSSLFSGGGAPAGSDASAMAPQAAEGVVGAGGTPEYNRMIEEDNAARADAARISGESYVPVPAGGGKGLAGAPLVRGGGAGAPAPAPPLAASGGRLQPRAPEPAPGASRGKAPAPERERPRASPKYENKAAESELKGIMGRAPGEMALIYTGAVFEKAGEKGAGGSAGAAGPGAGGALGIAPGDTLFAQMDTHLNSDVPSPVVATVAAGPLKGARAFGEFGLSGDQMRITFSRLALKGGGELKIEAFGVDPYTSKPSVRSTADHHHLSRWGGLIASSFIEGLGGAVSGRSARVYVGGDAVIEDKYGKTMRDSLFEAAGKAGERAAKAAERGFGRPPTVEVRAGEAVGILIITVSGKEG